MLSVGKMLPGRGLIKVVGWYIVFWVLAAVIFSWRLGDSVPGLSPTENATRQATASLDAVINNPINAPEKIFQYTLQALGHHGAFWLRLPSVAFAILFLTILYLILRNWFGRVVGLLATIILAGTPFFIQLARSGTDDILLLSPVVLLLSYSWLKKSRPESKVLSWWLLLVVSSLCLYVPGLIWFVVIGGIITRKQLISTAKAFKPRLLAVNAIVVLILLTPLTLALVGDMQLFKNLNLYPHQFNGLLVTLKGISWAILSLVWRTPNHINLMIGRTGILDNLEIVLAIFGVSAMWTKARRELRVVVGLILLGVVSAGINRNLILLNLAIPGVAVLIAAGLRYLYVEWRSVFPINPIPRTLAVLIMSGLVLLQVVYGLNYSLLAWPHTVATRQVYVIK